MHSVFYLYFTNNFTLDMLLLTNINPKLHVYTAHTHTHTHTQTQICII